MRDTLQALLGIVGLFLLVMYSCHMFYAILATPEPGWEFELAWDNMLKTLDLYWENIKWLFCSQK